LLRRCIPAHIGDRTVRVWSFRDVTAGQRALQWARASEADQRALLDAFPGFITRVDEGMTYTYVNERVAQRLGTSPELMLGRNAMEVIDPALAPWMRSNVERALAGEPVSYERVHPRGPGEALVDQVTMATGVDPVHGGRVVYTFGVDITDRKRAERAWLAARDEADRANRAKSEFLSRMSHELRTPLNAILGFSQIMERSRELGERHQRWVGEIIKAGRHLLDLVNEVLDLARVESGRFDVASEPVAVAPLVHDCIDLMRPLAQAAAVRLDLPEIDADLYVQADRTRLKQVLLDLLSNAVKYNRCEGQVEVDCEVQGDRVCVRLLDGILASRPAATLLHAGRPVNGLALARRHLPALILLDIHLPDMDGYEVLRLLRADPAIRGTPVLALSANAMPDHVARGRQAGFDDYLTKPLEVAQLFDHIDRTLARRGAAAAPLRALPRRPAPGPTRRRSARCRPAPDRHRPRAWRAHRPRSSPRPRR
jgi:PAS domain S-box-containing protein